MKQWICFTLIDITPTGVTRGDSKERNQQRNWETVLQVMGLKTQPIIHRDIEITKNINLEEVPTGYFGEFYQGSHTVWGFKFSSETEDVYTAHSLYEDFEQVPVVLGLDETARFMLPIFHSYGTLKNIYFFKSVELNTI